MPNDKNSASLLAAKDAVRFAMALYGHTVLVIDEKGSSAINVGVNPVRERVVRLSVVTTDGRFQASASMEFNAVFWVATQVEFQRGAEEKMVVDFEHGLHDHNATLHEEVRRLENLAVSAYFDALHQVVEGDGVLAAVKGLLDFGRIQLILFNGSRDGRKFHEVRISLVSADGTGVIYVLIGPKSWEPLYLEVQFGGELVTYEHISSGPAWHWRRRSVIKV